MREEYGEIIVSFLCMSGFYCLIGLILDLFHDGVFGIMAIVGIIVAFILCGIVFIIKVFRLNYKIKRR